MDMRILAVLTALLLGFGGTFGIQAEEKAESAEAKANAAGFTLMKVETMEKKLGDLKLSAEQKTSLEKLREELKNSFVEHKGKGEKFDFNTEFKTKSKTIFSDEQYQKLFPAKPEKGVKKEGAEE